MLTSLDCVKSITILLLLILHNLQDRTLKKLEKSHVHSELLSFNEFVHSRIVNCKHFKYNYLK
jgi:hypothetical protein